MGDVTRMHQQIDSDRQAPRDRFNQSLEVGDKVLYHNELDLIFEVAEMSPVLDPGAPPGLVRLTLVSKTKLHTMARVSTPNLIRLQPSGAPNAGLVES